MATGDAIIGALRVILGLDTAQFQSGTQQAQKQAETFADRVKAVFEGIGLERIVERIFDHITHILKETVVHAIEFGDQMGKMAQKVGVSVEEISGLTVAARLSDVSMESLSKSLGILSKNMVEAGKNGGEIRDQFQKLGVSTKDLANTNVVDVLIQIADKFETTKDGAIKVNAVLALMGRGAKDLIPLFNEGGDSIKKFAEIAKNMGLVIDKVQAEQSTKFVDNLKILKLAGEGVANMVAKDLLPFLVNLTTGFADTAKEGKSARDIADNIVSSFKQLSFQAIQLYVTLAFLKDTFTDLGNSTKKADDGTEKTLTGTARLRQGFIDLVDSIIAADQQTAIFGQKGGAGFKEPTEKAAELQRRLTDAKNVFLELLRAPAEVHVRPPLEDLETTASNLQKELDKLQLSTHVLLDDFKHLPTGFAELAVSLGLTAKDGSQLGLTFDQLDEKQKKLALGLLEFQAAQAEKSAQNPLEAYQNSLIQIDLLQQKIGLSAGAMAKLQTDAFVKLGLAIGNTAKEVVTGWADAFKILAEKNKQYAGIAKALAIAEATVNTFVAATKALGASIPPFNYIAAAGVVAAGLATVAKISATQFATGGSFTVGGSGGVDSQLVQFAATPGEMVDVRRPGQDRGIGGEITVRGIQPNQLFTGEMVRGLFDAINAGSRDGYRLVAS